jgi:hypothetical protein
MVPSRPSLCCAAATSLCCRVYRRCCRCAFGLASCSMWPSVCRLHFWQHVPVLAACLDSRCYAAPLLQKKWRAVEAHLLSDGPQHAPFRTSLLRLRLRDETQARGSRAACVAPRLHTRPAILWPSCGHSGCVWMFALQVAAALEQVAAASGDAVSLGSYPVR